MKKNQKERVWTTEKYNKVAKKYDKKMKRILPDTYRQMAADCLTGNSVLDIACGTGTFLQKAVRMGFSCTGMDLSPGMLEQAKIKLPEVRLMTASYYEIPFHDDEFDNVVSTYALGGVHVEVPKVLAEMVRVCKPGGLIIILDWQKKEKENILDKVFNAAAKLSEDQPRDFVGELKKLGLEVECRNLSYVISIIKSKVV